jgi:hypothetical protein
MQIMILMQLCPVIHKPVSFQTASVHVMGLLFQITWKSLRLKLNCFFEISAI